MANPWDSAPIVQQAQPKAPGVIVGPPKAPDPYQVQKDQFSQGLQLNAEGRATEDQAMQRQKFQLDQQKFQQDQEKLKLDQSKLTESQGKAASFGLRARDALTAYDSAGAAPEGMVGRFGNENFPTVTSQLSSDKRNSVRAVEREFIAAILRYDSGAAIPPSEFTSAYQTYFPNPNAGPEEIAAKKRIRETALQGLLTSAGPGANLIPRNVQFEGQFGDAQTPPQVQRLTPDQEKQLAALAPRATSGQDLVDLASTFGITIDPQDAQATVDYYRKGGTQEPVVDYGHADAQYQQQLRDRAAANERRLGAPGADDLVMQGAMGQLGDEAAGVGTAIGGLLRGNADLDLNYRLGRDTERTRLEQARKNAGVFALPAEILGGFASIGPGANALMPQSAAQAFRQGAVPGAVAGGITGFGSGEGFEGSTTNALLGAGLGGVIGGGLSAGGYAAAPVLGRFQRPAQDLGFTVDNAPATAGDVAAAGQAEGVTVNRAMVDPASRNRVTGAETTMAGGPIIQRGMKNVTRQIEGRTAQLGQGGTAMEPNVAGQTIEAAGKRFIEKSGKNIGQMYDRAVSLSQGVKVKPNEANQVLDDAIGRLSQTSNTNSAEIAYLQGLKQDLSKPLGVEALRDLRTTLRQKISKGDLVFGQNESRVLGVMDALSNDIRNGLNAAGRKDAANAFDQADGLYRQRMEFIQGAVQKLIGKRDANLPPERVFSNLKAMASPKGDEAGLAKMMRTMTPDEQADVAATFADALGKNGNGEFTTAQFVAQAEKLPEAARRHLFGDRGAESVKNLITLSKAHKAVPFNSSRTGVANDYRSWIANLFLGGGAGVATQSGTTGVAAAAAGVAAKTGRDILTARALMSPKITKWIVNAPKTSSPQAINQHFQRLGTIAAQEPALSGEIQVIQQRIMEAAKGGLSSPAPADDVSQAGQRPEQ